MKRILLILFLVNYTVSFSQETGLVFYTVEAIPPNATSFTVFFSVDIPDFPNKDVIGTDSYIIEIVDESEVTTTPIGSGEEVFFFGENFGEGSYDFDITYNLPDGVSFIENLPDGKVYRIGSYGGVLLDNGTFEDLGNVQSDTPNNQLDVGKDIIETRVAVTFLERPKLVVADENFTIETSILSSKFINETAIIRFEIHEVDKEDVYDIFDVASQNTLLSSTPFQTFEGSGNGTVGTTTEADFILKAPLIQNKDLPDGRTYRVRLFNSPGATSLTYPFPYELTVTDEATVLSSPDFNDAKQIALYPNPAVNIMSVETDIKTKTYKIYNASGALVNEAIANGKLAVSHLKTGVYFLVTDAGATKFVKK